MADFEFLVPARAQHRQLAPRTVRVRGIDLGTTNSAVAEAVWNSGERELPDADCLVLEQDTTSGVVRNVLVPSVVALLEGRTFVGVGAKRLRMTAAAFDLRRNESLFFDCKNDIGLRRTYERAPEGYRSAAAIAGHVLELICSRAARVSPGAVDRTVVTVPASFQAAQREDTLRAARLAGLELSGGDLLDEPVAAFVELLVSRHGMPFVLNSGRRSLVVFDFGGGTCDVAVFELEIRRGGLRPAISPLAVSRYHRLGGGDIDGAIVHEVLLPQLVEQNELGPFDLSFTVKKELLEPALLGVAETLKIVLCSKIRRARASGLDEDPRALEAVSPATFEVVVDDRELRLERPTLTAEAFARVLGPFLDEDLLYARETEYRLTGSIFAPLQDALDRADVDPKRVDYCLMVGGSCLIPQVVEAVSEFLPKAEVITYPDAESVQTAVARGAAYHALSLAVFGEGIVDPIAHERIAIRTQSGLEEIIPKGASLPYPSREGFARSLALAVPASSASGPVELRIEVVRGEDEQLLLRRIWSIDAPAVKGEPLLLDVRLDENQVLKLELRRASNENGRPFTERIENPLTHVVNPQDTRLRIEESEEALRTGCVPAAEVPARLSELASDYAELGQREKALDYYRKALKRRGGPDAVTLNRMGIVAGEIGDAEREEKFYRESAAADPDWGAPLFNLALAQRRRGEYAKASETVEEALRRERDAPYLVLRAQIAEGLGDAAGRARFLEEGLGEFGPVPGLDDWSLGWHLTGARMSGDEELVAAIEQEQKKRRRGTPVPGSERGQLPIRSVALERFRPDR